VIEQRRNDLGQSSAKKDYSILLTVSHGDSLMGTVSTRVTCVGAPAPTL
jgi:hypothetical protein